MPVEALSVSRLEEGIASHVSQDVTTDARVVRIGKDVEEGFIGAANAAIMPSS